MIFTKQKARRFCLASLAFASCFCATQVRAGKPVFVGSERTQTIAIEQIDHAPWNALLAKYVDADGMVNYRDWKASAADQQSLNNYLLHLSSANAGAPSSQGSKLAFWINAYNAVTVHGILREFPTTSIRNHTAKVLGYNIWHDLRLYVGGTAYSLDSIEHKILRKMNEPRIHFAIVCASIGCPRLLNQAYTANQIQQQLELNAKDFFARGQNFQHDVNGNRFMFSAIIDWFGADFGRDQASQLRLISRWLPTQAAQAAAQQNSVSVAFLDYNWQLNAQ